MAFEDSLIGDGNDFDPRAAMESLIRQNAAEPLPDTLDPRMLNTRLARKLNQPAPEPEPVDVRPAAKPVADFSAQAVEPTTPNANLDFSDQAETPTVVNPAATPPAPGISSTAGLYATEFGKGVAEGAKNMGASALKGSAAVSIPTQADPTLLDELGNAKDMTPSARAKLMGRVLRGISDRGLQMDYNAALRRISQGADPSAEIEALRPKFEANNKSATEPVTDKKLYKAGQAVEDFGKEALAPAPGFEGSWTRDIGSGAGSMAAGIATSMIPGIGPAAAGALFTAGGMGEAAEKAVKSGADNDQIRRATMLGGVAGATDLVDALLPMLGSTGKALGFLKRVGIAAVKGAIMEGGQEGVQQLMQNAIAKGIYKPDQDLFEDVPRSVAVAAILGGAGGGISGAASRGRSEPGPALPPGSGAQPGTGPTSGGPSSPEDIADFVRKTREGNSHNSPNNENNENPAPMSEAERQQSYTASRESHGGASEAEILKAAGLDPTTMDEQERIDAVIKAKKADATSNADGSADAQPGASEPHQAEESHLRYATLREYGYSDEDIDAMPESQRKREFADAKAEGIEPGKAMSKHKKRAPKAAEPENATTSPDDATDTTGLKAGFKNMAGGIGESLRDHLWARAEAGEVTENSSMGPTAMLQGAKMIRERGGLQTRDEFLRYAEEQDKLVKGSPTYQQDMRALVAKYAPPSDTGQNVPESRATLKAQQNQLIKGERVAQMFPTGTKEMPLPPGMERVEIERGIFHFDPKKADAETIKKVSAEGRENELLGLGSFTKEDIAARAGEPNVTIVERTPDGTEVRAAVGTPSTSEQQRAEMEKGKSKGNTVSIETPEQTLDGRNGKGTRAEPIDIKSARDVDRAAKAGATDYTPAQGEANNRQLGHAKWNGLPISLEVAKGGVRKMVNPETGEAVEVTHAGAAYGYFPGTIGADKMHVDVYFGEHPESPHVFVIDEIDRDTKKFRQHKVMAGFLTERDAFAAYVGTSTKGPETVGAISTLSVPELKEWLSSGDTTKALKKEPSSGPDKAGEGSNSFTEAPVSSGSPKGSPDASLGGDSGVRPETTIPETEKSFGQQSGNPKKDSSGNVGKRTDEPLSLLQFVASRGGLRPDPELNAIGLAGDHRVQIPGRKGFFGVIKATGDSLDNMREAAEEAGYLRGEHNKTSTVRDFLDAIDTEMRGGAHRAEGEEGKKSKRERTSLAESSAAARDKALAENVAAIQAEYTELPEGLAEQAATIMADEMLDLDSAVEMAAVRAVNEDTDYDITENEITATYGEGAFDALQTRSASADGGPAAPAGDQEQRSNQGEEAVADGEPDADAGTQGREEEVKFASLPDDMQDMIEQLAPDRFEAGTIPKTFPVVSVKVAELPAIPLDEFDRGSDYAREMDLAKVPPILIAYGQFVDGKHRVFKAREDGVKTLPAIDLTGIADRATIEANGMGVVGPQFESTPAGEQTILPGAERIGQGEQAQRRADQGLKPTKPQKAMDDGLFGDSMNQIELLLGTDADKVSPVDIARGAELMADNPGMDAPTAFGQAVVINAVEQGFITEQEAEEAYGPEVKPALEAASAGAHQRGSDLEPEGVNVGEVGSDGAAEAGVVSGSGEDIQVDDGQLDDTAGTQPDAAGDAGGAAVNQGTSGTETADIARVAPKNFIADGAGKDQRAAVILANGQMWEFSRSYALAGKWNGLGAHARFREEGGHTNYLEVTAFADKSASIHGADYVSPAQRRAINAIKAQAKRTPGFDLNVAYMEDDADIKDAGESHGVQASLHAGDAPAGAEDVQPAEPVGRAGSVREREGGGSEQAVPRADGERAEGSGRVSEGARGERSDRAGDGGNARLSEARADDTADGRARRNERKSAHVEGENFVIEPGALDEGRGQKQKAKDNIRAIELVGLIESENRPATEAEQVDLAKYVGWGGIKNIFPDEQGNYGAGFDELGAKLKDLLLDVEYVTARRSIQYAHYTAEDVVRSMWSAVEKMGFKGGQVFEPGMGIGNFAGMMPQDIAANTHYQGVELDHVTARIAKLLYPKYGVRQDDFTKTKLPENSYDLVIGNPPFADVAIKSDPKYKQGFLLHDYFFAKSLDAVRPGGLLAFVTSAGTMNKLDPVAREYLADRADLVGAIRLPGDAFMKNAGTMVTTDIIFLRKRLPGDVAGDRTWTETKVVSLPGKEGMIEGNVNRYISEHPEMVLGKPDFNDRLYPGRYSVKSMPGSDIRTDLARAIGKLPADVMRPWQDVNAEHTQHDFDTTEKKEGTYYVGPDGSLHQVNNGVGQKVGQRGKGVENGRTAADMERIKALIPVRDALRQVYAFDLKGDTGNADRARAQLNKSYDEFVAKHGPINKAVIQTRRPNVIQMEAARDEAREAARYANEVFKEGTFDASDMIEAKVPASVIARERQKAREEAAKAGLPFDEGDFDIEDVPDVIIDKRPNVDPFMDDPESYRLRAIERYDEGTGVGHKSPVFFENIITREMTPKISSVHDGLLYSLSQYGRVNIPAIAELTKKSDAQVIEELSEQVFKVPGTKDAFQTRDEYLSGNVRKKLELAQRAADRNPEFRRNVAALEASQPMPLAPSQIHASLGMPWIPQAEIEKFGMEELGLEKLRVRYTAALASWSVSGDIDSVAARSTWGTEDRRAPSILQSALNRQTVKVYDEVRLPDGKKSSVLNVAKTEAANDKLMAMREKFSGWLWTDQERADRLAAFYNENYNNLVVREYDGSYLTTPGIASHWSWRPHQKRVIARVIQSGNTYIAHAVGGGKTSEYIGAIMEMRRLGLVRKPMVAVPNHMLAQFTKEWYEQYPTARLAIADDKRFHTDKRKQFVANVALDDLDAIIITHSSFGMIPVSAEFENGIINREISQYRAVLAEIKNDGDSRITRSRIEKQIERLEQRLVSRKGRKDSVFTFEEMGVDHLTIDEAHLFRKLDFTTAMSNLKGVSPDGSQMAWDLYVKSLYLNSVRPGRGLVLGSGTPITNTMAELYTLSRYMQPEVLAERGLEKFDAWAGAFGESVSELEQDAAGNYKPVSRFAKFVNVAELSAMVRQVMDVVTSKQLEQYVTRPQIQSGKRQMVLAEKSRELVRFQESLAARMVKIQKRKGPPAKGDDIMLSVINDGRHAAIDMRLAGGDASNIPSKLELMADNVYRIWEESKRQKFHKVAKEGGYEAKPAMSGPATQLVFINLGLSGARGFSVPDYLRAELHRRGVPKNEIAYIYDFKSATAKQRLFNDMNEGKVRILMGSVAKMGVGTNVQRRLLAIHNMDPLWYPADDEQRNGRGIRQGNMNPEIGIWDYSTKGTYDSTMWGMMEKKARFIQGFFEGDPSLRDMDDLGEASQYEQAKALTTNDPRLIRFTELKQDLERANRRKTAFDSDVYNTRQNRQKAKAQIEHYDQRIVDTKKDIAQRIDTRGEAFNGTVGKESFDKRADFGVALFDRLGVLEDSGSLKGGVKVASVGGFDIYATVHKSNLLKDHTTTDVFMALNGNATREVSYDTSSLGTVRSIESILHGFESDLVEYEHRLEKAEKFFRESKAKAEAKFEGDADIAALAKQVDDLAAELRASAETPAAAAATEGPDLAQLSDMAPVLTLLADDKHAEISSMLTAIVRAVAGDVPTLEFHKGLIPVKPPPGYPAGMKPVAAGQYRLGAAILRLALTNDADQMAATAFHESYHHIEDRLQTPAERDLMKAETPRLREWIKGKTGMTDAQVDGLAGFEVRAIAFQTYAGDRVKGRGIHIGVRRWFERLMELLTRIRNGLKGLGFNTYKGVFDDAFTGKFAAREARETGGIDPVDLAALSDLYGAVADRVSNKFGERATELRVKLQDRFIRVRHAQASVGGVRTAHNTYQAESLLPGRTGQRLEQLEREKFEPLVEAMDEHRIGLEEMSDYLYAKHAPERNLAMDAINHPNLQGTGGRDLRGRGSGMSDEEAQAIMDRITAAGRMADFQVVEGMVRDIQQGTIDTLVSYGLISEETAAAWASQYDFYAPLQGFAEGFEDEVSNMARGMGMDTRARESKQAFGRLSKAAGPLPYIMMQAELAIVRGEKNKVGNTFLRFVNAHPDPRRWSINRPKMVKTIDNNTGLVTMVADNQWHNDPNVFVTKVGGQRVIIRLEGNEGLQLARALKNMGVEDLNDFLRFMRAITVTMARLSTQWNPNFVVPNLVRDLGEAYINLQEQDKQHFVKQFTKHIIPSIGGSFQALRGKHPAPGSNRTLDAYIRAFHEFDAAGGRIRFFGLDNAVDVEKSIRRQMRRLQGGPIATIQEAGKTLAEAFDTVNSSMENATRLAAYMAARDVGMSVPDSANLALNLTVNFTKKGELGPAMNSLWMFAGATMQGGRRTFSALKNKHVRRATYVLIGLGALSAMLAYGAGGDDDSGESYYSKVPQWERDKNLIIMWPKGYGRDGGYIKLPLPFLFGAFKVLGDRLVGVMLGKDKPLDAMGSVIKAVLDGLSPLGEEGGTTLSPKALLPSVFRPAVHIMDNQNWNGRQLYPARDFEKNKPDSEQFFSTTPEYAKTAARGLNKLGGGSPYKSSGALDVHPGSIQHVLESLTGGLGKFISDVAGTADRAWKGEAFDATKAPIARRFVGSANTEQADASRYYADREEARKNGGEAIKNARRDRAKGVNVNEAESFLANNQNSMGAEQIFKNADEAMKPLRTRKARIEAGDSFGDEQRTEVESIKTRMREIQNRARKQYRELRGAQ